MDLSSEDSKPIPIPTADMTEITLQDLGEEELHRAFEDDTSVSMIDSIDTFYLFCIDPTVNVLLGKIK